MSFIIQRTYKLGDGNAIDTDASAPSASLPVAPSVSEEHVTTRTCHRWSYVDASRHETCIVTLQAHYSLHVDVKGRNPTDATSTPQPTGGRAERSTRDDGLCGFSWEFIWIPNPHTFAEQAADAASSTSTSSDTYGAALCGTPQPARARFFFPRTTLLARSTIQGTGGVVFVSSRHVLVATEAPETPHSVRGPSPSSRSNTYDEVRSAPFHGLMDSFVLSSGDAAAMGLTARLYSWTRIAAATALPCLFATPQAPASASSTSTQSRPSPVLLLVTGVPLPQQEQQVQGTAAGAEAPLVRLLYLFSAPCTSNGRGCDQVGQQAWDVLACVADLSSTSASADSCHQLHVQIRHTVTLPQIRLSVHEATAETGPHHYSGATKWEHGRCGADGASCTLSPSPAPQWLSPHDLLWVFVEEKDARDAHLLRDGQLCGSLVALLPCWSAPARAWEASSLTSASPHISNNVPSPPAVLSGGFHDDTPYGALMVSSVELESHASVHPQRTISSTTLVQDIIDRLLPSSERSVYRLVVGSVTRCISASASLHSRATTATPMAAAPAALPAHTSLLVFIMDGLHTRNLRSSAAVPLESATQALSAPSKSTAASALPQGLYLTETLSWDTLAHLASPAPSNEQASGRMVTVHLHRVPLTRTLWCGLDPLVLSVSARAYGIMSGDGRDSEHEDVLQETWDVDRWIGWLPKIAGGGAESRARSDDCAAPLVGDSATDAENFLTPASLPSTATVTAVPSCMCPPSSSSTATAVFGFPFLNDLNRELTVLWCCCTTAAGCRDGKPHKDTAEQTIAHLPPPVTPSQATVYSQEEWEAEVAEWVAAAQIRGLLRSSTTSTDDAAVAVITYRAMRILWAYAALCETGPALPQWPSVLMEVVRNTCTDTATHQTRLRDYASAVQTVMTAQIASDGRGDAAVADSEVRQMRRAAGVFFRLVLRTLVELDWCAGDTVGWMCFQWTVRWFLGCGAGTVASTTRPTNSSTPTVGVGVSIAQERAAVVEGLAMQVLLQWGAGEDEAGKIAAAPLPKAPPLPPLDWIRRALMLFVCRRTQLPLELTMEDIVTASGVRLHPIATPQVTQATVANGWSETSDEEKTAPARTPWLTHNTIELRDSMEYALLRLVKPEMLYSMVHHLARTSPAPGLHRIAAFTGSIRDRDPRMAQRVFVRGVLTVADLHVLLCVGWASGQPHYAAPPGGFTFVCCVVDLAMMFTSAVPPLESSPTTLPEAYERLVIAALDTWGGRGEQGVSSSETQAATMGDQDPVYPLLSVAELDNFGVPQRTTRVRTPFPFTILPPLLTVYLWYHMTHRLCAALQLPPLMMSEITGEEEARLEGEQEHAPWLQRAKLRDGTQLQALYRGVCVLRYLTQEDATATEELFSAMHLVYGALPRHGGHQRTHWQGESAGAAYVTNTIVPVCDTASAIRPRVPDISWVTLYLVSWHDLISLEAPPLCSKDTLLAYQERRHNSTVQHGGDPMRVLHLLYSSTMCNRILRAQVLKMVGIPNAVITGAVSKEYIKSYECLVCTLWNWRTALKSQQHCCTETSSIPTTAEARRTQYAAAADAMAAWLVQVWANVLLCDPEAVTDAGMYENLFTILAHVKQRGDPPSYTSVSTADVAFALLRPCFLHALPILEDLSVEEELMRSQGIAVAPPSYPQYNESLARNTWDTGPQEARASHHGRAPERLGAKEVFEQLRERLRCLVALYVSPSISTGATFAEQSDRRFRTLALLTALQPTVVKLAAAQQRIEQHRMKHGALQRDAAESDESKQISGAGASSPLAPTSSDESESMLELRSFHLSAAATYVIAATAAALGYTKNHMRSGTEEEVSSGTAKGQPVGWLVVACEVIRRELSQYILEELQMNGYVQRTVTFPAVEAIMEETTGGTPTHPGLHHPHLPVPGFRLATSEAQLKEFINALADAVAPLTRALAKALSLALVEPLVTLLVLDVLHTLLHSSSMKNEQEAGGTDDGPTQRSPETEPPSIQVSISTDALTLGLLAQWIRSVAMPLYQQMSDADKNVVRHIVTGSFAHDYLTAPHSDALSPSPGSAPPLSTSYHASGAHAEWRQWRQSRGKAVKSHPSPKAAAMLECLSASVVAAHQPLVQVVLPKLHEGKAAQQAVAVTATATTGSSWAGTTSALRTSIFNVGAVLAPRPAHQHQKQYAEVSSSAAVPLSSMKPQLHAAPAEAPRVGLGSSKASAWTMASPDEAQLLQREEACKRRQCGELLLREQQHLFASPVFQRSLVKLYLALRVEKRRRELVAYALDQHDLICSFCHREQMLRLNAAREELRRAWCEWGERQRTARQRVLQEERDTRVGVQAIAYASWTLLLDAEQQERLVWVLYEEGRAGLLTWEEEARDALTTAATHAQVEIAKWAAEAAEEAYWKEEEAAWERIQEEEEQQQQQLGTGQSAHQWAHVMKTKSAQPRPLSLGKGKQRREESLMSSSTSTSYTSSYPSAGCLSNRPMNQTTPLSAVAPGHRERAVDKDRDAAVLDPNRPGDRKRLDTRATVPTPVHSFSDCVGGQEACNAVAPAQVTASDSAMASVASQNHLQQRAAPPHTPSLMADVIHTENGGGMDPGWEDGLAKAAVSTAGGLFNALSQWQTVLRNTVAPPPPTRDSEIRKSRQRTDFEQVADLRASRALDKMAAVKETDPREPVLVLGTTTDGSAAAQGEDWGWSSNSDTSTHSVEQKRTVATTTKEEVCADRVLAPPSHRVVTLRGKGTSVVGEASLATAVTAKPPRKKRGFAAAVVRIDPIPAAANNAAPLTSSPLSPPFQPTERHLSFSEAATTPNPARSILSAVEAAATETLSRPPAKLSSGEELGRASLPSPPQGLESLAAAPSGWCESSTSSGSSSNHSATSPLWEPCTQLSTAPMERERCAEVKTQGRNETQCESSTAHLSGVSGQPGEVLGCMTAAVDQGNAEMWRKKEDREEIQVGNSASQITCEASSHCCALGVGPLSLPAVAAVDKPPTSDGSIRAHGWEWSTDGLDIGSVAEKAHPMSLPSSRRAVGGAISVTTEAPPLSEQLLNFSTSSAKDGWSSDDSTVGSDTAITALRNGANVAPSTSSGSLASATQCTALVHLQDMYAAELRMRVQLLELL